MADEDDVLGANTLYYAAFNSRDVQAMDACWARETEVSCIHPGWQPLHGRIDVMDSWRSIFANGGAPTLTVDRLKVVVQGLFAYVSCRESLAGRGTERGDGIAATNVFVREGSGWRVLIHHASPVASWNERPVRSPPRPRASGDSGGSGGLLN